MNKGNLRNPSKKAGLSVRYCIDGEEILDTGAGGDEDIEDESLVQTSTGQGGGTQKSARPRLSRPNYWFQPGHGASLNRRTRVATGRIGHFSTEEAHSRFESIPAANFPRNAEWREDGEEDVGFFVTTRVEQPPKEDMLSWDSASASSSDTDIRDIFARNNRGNSNNYQWGSSRPPLPPCLPSRNVSANKGEETTRSSATNHSGHHKKVENTYRMEPKPGQWFVWYKVKRPMVNIVDNLLGEFVYNVRSGPAVTRKLCEVLMKMVKKQFDFPRYRYVCNVALVQLKRQGIMIADRALWNTSTDNSASYVYKNKDLVCAVTFHGFYTE